MVLNALLMYTVSPVSSVCCIEGPEMPMGLTQKSCTSATADKTNITTKMTSTI